MTRDDIDAEQREQARDQRRERAAWCREKLGVNVLDWLPQREKTMPLSEQWAVSPSGYELANGTGPFTATPDPIGDCVTVALDGDTLLLSPGAFPPIKKSFAGRKNFTIRGWKDAGGNLQSSILPDLNVGSTDNVLLGAGTSGFVLDSLLIPLDDRAGLKTTSGVGPHHSMLNCRLYGPGSPSDPAWAANTKWGVHTYDLAGYSEIGVWKWSIFGEHGDYHHNFQGNHGYSGGGVGNLGGCDIYHANRMNEGAIGKGDVNIQDRYTEDVCVVQGGAAFSFFGGMPTSRVNFKRVTVRLGCKRSLAAPFNQNICGVLSTRPSTESAPGRGDMAYPGGVAEVNWTDSDVEVGTIYPGRTGMIRPVLDVSDCGLFTWLGGRLKVTRSPGAYPLGLNIEPSVQKVAIGAVGGSSPDFEGWIQYHGDRHTSLAAFLNAHPECAA